MTKERLNQVRTEIENRCNVVGIQFKSICINDIENDNFVLLQIDQNKWSSCMKRFFKRGFKSHNITDYVIIDNPDNDVLIVFNAKEKEEN